MAIEDVRLGNKSVIIGGATIGVAVLAFSAGNLLGAGTVSVLCSTFGKSLGESTNKLIGNAVGKFSEKFLDTATEPAIDGFRKSHPTLEDIFREAFRLSLLSIAPRNAEATRKVPDVEAVRLNLSSEDVRVSSTYADWFDNWDAALKKDVPINLYGIDFNSIDEFHDNPDKAGICFKATMERIDAQGTMIRLNKEASITLPLRAAPEQLLSELKKRLPKCFSQFVRELLVKPENITAMNESEFEFRAKFLASFEQIGEHLRELRGDTATIREVQAIHSQDLIAIRERLNAQGRPATSADVSVQSKPVTVDDFLLSSRFQLERLTRRLARKYSLPLYEPRREAECVIDDFVHNGNGVLGIYGDA